METLELRNISIEKEIIINNPKISTLILNSNGGLTIEIMECLVNIFKNKGMIESLHINHNWFSDTFMFYIAEILKYDTLHELDLSENIIKTGCKILVSGLKNNTKLKKLNLRKNMIGGNYDFKWIKKILKFNVIEELNLSENQLDNSDITILFHALKFNSSLQNLDLSNNDITYTEMFKICESFISLGNKKIGLKKLNLSGNDIHNKSFNLLFAALKVYPIKFLNLSYNRISRIGCLAESLSFIKYLDLSHNKLSIRSMINLADVISTSKLEYLNLSHVHKRRKGIYRIINSLKYNSSLVYLNLSGNNINSSCAICLVESLHSNSTLKYLDLSWNYIGEKGAVPIIEYLKTSTLIYLDLSWNELHNNIYEPLVKMLKNTNLQYLNLDSNYLGLVKNKKKKIENIKELQFSSNLQYLNLSNNYFEQYEIIINKNTNVSFNFIL